VPASGPSTSVSYLCLLDQSKLPASRFGPEAEVDVLEVEVVSLVETTNLGPAIDAQSHGRTTEGLEGRGRLLQLPDPAAA